MNKEEIFAAWAPAASLWSAWTKPVLFAHLESLQADVHVDAAQDVNWCPSSQDKTVLVVDLPGAEGVLMGVALAGRNYRPVPLYNAIPCPIGGPIFEPLAKRNIAAVDILPIISTLRTGAKKLVELQILSDAPPAFLLDANRHGDRRIMEAGEFDNRSVSFVTDFPSADFLVSHGIRNVLLVQKHAFEPQWDLVHVLRRWQKGGIKLERLQLERPLQRESFTIGRPSWFGALFVRVLRNFGLRRTNEGGFGAWIPESSSGG